MTTMTFAQVEAYLLDAQSRIDIAEQFFRRGAQTDSSRDRWTIMSPLPYKKSPWTLVFCAGAEDEGGTLPGEPSIWYPTHGAVFAYYMQQGDRFVVSDLGGGIRSYGLRTGSYGGPLWQAFDSGIPEAVSCWPKGSKWRDGAIWADGDEPGKNQHFGAGIKADDLPEAICLVILASLRVSRCGLPE